MRVKEDEKKRVLPGFWIISWIYNAIYEFIHYLYHFLSYLFKTSQLGWKKFAEVTGERVLHSYQN